MRPLSHCMINVPVHCRSVVFYAPQPGDYGHGRKHSLQGIGDQTSPHQVGALMSVAAWSDVVVDGAHLPPPPTPSPPTPPSRLLSREPQSPLEQLPSPSRFLQPPRNGGGENVAAAEVWYSREDLERSVGGAISTTMAHTAGPARVEPTPKDNDHTTSQVTVESILGHRCIDWNGATDGKSSVRVWNCKTKKGTWFEGPYQRLERVPHRPAAAAAATTAISLATMSSMFQLRLEWRSAALCLQGTRETSTVVFGPCSNADSGDEAATISTWSFEQRTGRHKAYGVLVNVATGMCLSRAVDDLLVVVTEPCSPANATARNCRQLWALPLLNTSRYMNRIDSEMRIAPPPPAPPPVPRQGAPKIVCWILTFPKTHENRAVAVNRTWGRHCDVLLFMTTTDRPGIPTVVLNLGAPESRNMIFTKTKLAWMYVYKRHLADGDFFLKADDDTYVVWDHLVNFLRHKNASELRYFGRQFVPRGNLLHPLCASRNRNTEESVCLAMNFS